MTSSRSPHRSWTTWSGSKTVTGAPDARSAAGRAGLLPCLLAAAALASGCATTPPKKTPPADPAPKPVAAVAEKTAPASAEKESPSAPAPAEPAAPQTSDPDGPLVVVKPGGKAEEGASTSALVEASRAERERRAKAAQPRVVINDKNLPKYATGTLTFMEPERRKEGEEAAANAAETARKEAYWRQRGLEIRQRWRRLADEVKDLETSAADWRQRFYAQDDPYVRDGKIKPEWDRVLDRLAQTRREVDTARQELEQYMEEGRRAGALPGWLRAGTELEPKEEAAQEQTVNPQEPSVYEEKTKHE